MYVQHQDLVTGTALQKNFYYNDNNERALNMLATVLPVNKSARCFERDNHYCLVSV